MSTKIPTYDTLQVQKQPLQLPLIGETSTDRLLNTATHVSHQVASAYKQYLDEADNTEFQKAVNEGNLFLQQNEYDPKAGYLNLKGDVPMKAKEDRFKAVEDWFKTREAQLANPNQKKKFRQWAEQTLVGFKGHYQRYALGEYQAYQGETLENAQQIAKAAVIQASNDAQLSEGLEQLRQASQAKGRFQGHTEDTLKQSMMQAESSALLAHLLPKGYDEQVKATYEQVKAQMSREDQAKAEHHFAEINTVNLTDQKFKEVVTKLGLSDQDQFKTLAKDILPLVREKLRARQQVNGKPEQDPVKIEETVESTLRLMGKVDFKLWDLGAVSVSYEPTSQEKAQAKKSLKDAGNEQPLAQEIKFRALAHRHDQTLLRYAKAQYKPAFELLNQLHPTFNQLEAEEQLQFLFQPEALLRRLSAQGQVFSEEDAKAIQADIKALFKALPNFDQFTKKASQSMKLDISFERPSFAQVSAQHGALMC